jgi:ADP-ribose pyrophosphatase YjhB (NUDIX family)
MNKKGWIDEILFMKIKRSMPIDAVDILALYQGRLLLMLRNNGPAKNEWFTPGGRILYGETLEDAVVRKLHEETCLKATNIGKSATMSHIYSDAHYVTTFFRVDVTDDKVRFNEEHRDFKWISSLETNLHPYVRQMIEELGIFSGRIGEK